MTGAKTVYSVGEALTMRRLTTTEVCELTRWSPATLRRRISAGLFPAPCERARESLWRADQVDAALNGEPYERPNNNQAFDLNAFNQARLAAPRRAASPRIGSRGRVPGQQAGSPAWLSLVHVAAD